MSLVEVLLPKPSEAPVAWSGSSGAYPIAGRKIALVDNGWNSSGELVRAMDGILRAGYGVADVLHFKNPRFTKTGVFAPYAPPEFLEEIADSATVAVVVLGN